MIINTKTNRTLQKENMLLSSLVLFIAVGKSLCSVDQDCDDIFDCESCTSQDSWNGGDTCRWCPLNREWHAFGSPVNHCISNQNIRMPWQCESKSYGHYNPQEAYEQALFSTAAYSADPQSCLDQIMPDGGFEVVDIINGSCDYLFEYEDCFAYTAVSVDKKTILVAFRGTEEMTQLTEQALMVLFKRKTRFKTGGKVQKYFANAFYKLYPCVYDSVGDLVKRYPDFTVRITGHSLGGAIASLSSAALVYDTIVQKDRMSLYTFGMPRVGGKVYAASHDRLVNNSWRVVHYKDPVSHLPMCNVITGCGVTNGPHHHRTEVFYPSANMTTNSAYVICKGNEDNNCSNGVMSEDSCLPDLSECMDYHLNYFGIPIGTYCQQLGSASRNSPGKRYFRKILAYTCDRIVRKWI